MQSILTVPVDGSVAWKGTDLVRDPSWIHQITDQDLDEIELALRKVKDARLQPHAIRRKDFPLPTMEARLASVSNELEWGRGFVQMKGVPVDRLCEDDTRLVYAGIASYLGTAVSQNAKGDLIGDVRDLGLDIRKQGTRGYQTNTASPFHADESDVVGLLCLRPARSGGASCIVSSVAVYNALLERYPWYAALLYRPMNFDWRGEQPEGAPPVYRWPVFEYFDGRLACRYSRRMIEFAQKTTGVRLTRVETEAFDILDRLIDELRLDIQFEAGDIQFLNNYVILHSRTEFEDYPEPQRKRHLLRLWLTSHNGRKLSPEVLGERNVRAGVPVRS